MGKAPASDSICKPSDCLVTLVHGGWVQTRWLRNTAEHWFTFRSVNWRFGLNTSKTNLVGPLPQWTLHFCLELGQCGWISVLHLEKEVQRRLVFWKDKAAGPDGLSPIFFEEDDQVLTWGLTKLMGSTWEKEDTPQCQRDWVVVPICRKDNSCLQKTHRRFSFVIIERKLLAGFSAQRIYDNYVILKIFPWVRIYSYHSGLGCINQFLLLDESKNTGTCFADPRLLSPLIWEPYSIEWMVLFSGNTSHLRLCQRSSFHASNLCM